MYGIAVDGNVAVFDADRIKPQGIEFPAAADLPIGQIEGSKVARAYEAASLDPPLRQVRFFVRTRALEGIDGVTLTRQDERMAFDGDANKATIRQPVQIGDNDKARIGGVHIGPAGGRGRSGRDRVGNKRRVAVEAHAAAKTKGRPDQAIGHDFDSAIVGQLEPAAENVEHADIGLASGL